METRSIIVNEDEAAVLNLAVRILAGDIRKTDVALDNKGRMALNGLKEKTITVPFKKITCPKCKSEDTETNPVAGAYLHCNACGHDMEELGFD